MPEYDAANAAEPGAVQSGPENPSSQNPGQAERPDLQMNTAAASTSPSDARSPASSSESSASTAISLPSTDSEQIEGSSTDLVTFEEFCKLGIEEQNVIMRRLGVHIPGKCLSYDDGFDILTEMGGDPQYAFPIEIFDDDDTDDESVSCSCSVCSPLQLFPELGAKEEGDGNCHTQFDGQRGN